MFSFFFANKKRDVITSKTIIWIYFIYHRLDDNKCLNNIIQKKTNQYILMFFYYLDTENNNQKFKALMKKFKINSIKKELTF